MTELEFDVVVAGSGAGGGFCAMALCEMGLKVLVLERGRRFAPGTDFPMNHRDWEQRANVLQQTQAKDLTMLLEPGVPIPATHQDLCSAIPGRETPCWRRGPFRYQRVIGLGGSTLHYQGEAHRFPAHAFAPRTLFDWGEDWPITYADLQPYYARAERVLGVAGNHLNPFKPKRGPYPTPAHALSTRTQLVARGARQLGWSVLANSLALPSRSTDGRRPCQHSGGCVLGCIFGAKSSVDLTAIARGERTGRMTVLTQARLVHIESDPTGPVGGFVYSHLKKHQRVRAHAYVLALGAIETPRVLLVSNSPPHPEGIGNANDQVGRYLMETVIVSLLVRADRPVQAYKGPPIDARIWDFSKPPTNGPVRTGFVLGVSNGIDQTGGPLAHALRISGFGREHKQRMREQFGTLFKIFAIAEHQPRADNRVVLIDRTDTQGTPLVRVHSDYSQLDRRALRAMIARCSQLAEACSSLSVVSRSSSYSNPSATHVGGTCRMGVAPERSVVDAYGQVHGVPNLFISDASVLPSQGAGDSPSLTIQALALRTADRIRELGQRGRLRRSA